jgi:hypothetical protein
MTRQATGNVVCGEYLDSPSHVRPDPGATPALRWWSKGDDGAGRVVATMVPIVATTGPRHHGPGIAASATPRVVAAGASSLAAKKRLREQSLLFKLFGGGAVCHRRRRGRARQRGGRTRGGQDGPSSLSALSDLIRKGRMCWYIRMEPVQEADPM